MDEITIIIKPEWWKWFFIVGAIFYYFILKHLPRSKKVEP